MCHTCKANNLHAKGYTVGKTNKGRSVKVQGMSIIWIVDEEMSSLYCIYDMI